MYKPQNLTHTGVAKSFSHAARRYDHWAIPQQAIATKLVAYLADRFPDAPYFRSILDVGCGTGFLTGLLHKQYRQARLDGIDITPGMIAYCEEQFGQDSRYAFKVADAKKYTAPACYEIIASSCVFQWFQNPQAVIRQLNPLLREGGVWALAVPVHGSFYELRAAYQAVTGAAWQGLALPDAQVLLAGFVHPWFVLHFVQEESFTYRLTCPENILRHFKNIGADFQHQPGYTPLGFKETKALLTYYRNQYQNPAGELPVTYHVLFVLAEKRAGEGF